MVEAIATSSKKLLGAPGIATRSKDALRLEARTGIAGASR